MTDLEERRQECGLLLVAHNLMSPEILEKCDPIRRQLLGDGVNIKGWWQPTDADVPLKTWIAEHRGKEYIR